MRTLLSLGVIIRQIQCLLEKNSISNNYVSYIYKNYAEIAELNFFY